MRIRLLTAALLCACPSPAQQDEIPTRTAAEALLERLDDAFNRRDVAGLLAAFEEENQQLMRVFSERMTAVLEGPVRLRRQSEIESYTTLSCRGVALVRSTVFPLAAPDSVRLEEYSYLVVKRRGDRAVGSFTVEVNAGLLDHTLQNRFRCPPCNYEVLGAPGWLAVPHNPARTQCMEAISFYYLGADLTLDVSVFVDPEPLQADAAMRSYLGALLGGNTALDVEISAWIPPVYGSDPPAGLDGAAAELQLPGFQISDHYLTTFGSMRYLMVLSGNLSAWKDHRHDAEALLESFRILDPAPPADELAAMPVREHTGGSDLDGNRFSNPTYRVAFEGPEGWMASVRAAGYLFEVAFRCPLGRGAVWATAHGPQPGLSTWDTRIADTWLEGHCRENGMDILEDSGWRDPGAGFRLRDLETTAPRNSVGAEALPRLIRLALSDDLLLVLHGYGQEPADRDQVKACFDTLRRTR